MVTVLDALKGISAYPVPLRTLSAVSLKRGIQLEQEATEETLTGKAYRLAEADILMWLSAAPSISQGGQSFSFTEEQRREMRNKAKRIYAEFGNDGETATKPIYGYKGSRL